MTIQEMHIAVNLGVQKIASFQVDNLLPQEIDHELNVAMEKFIKQRYSPMGNKYRDGFEQSQKRIDDLRNLVVRRKIQTNYYGESLESGTFFIERAPFPQDYMFLINVVTNMKFNCAGPIPVFSSTPTRYYFSISLTPPVPGYLLQAIQYYDPNNPTSIGGNFIYNESGMEQDYYNTSENYLLGVSPVDSRKDSLADELYEPTPTVDSNTLLLEIDSNAVITNGWRALWVNPLTQDIEIVDYAGQSPITQTLVKRDNPNYPEKKVTSKYIQHDDLSVLYDPFNTTTHKYPKYTIQENFIDVYSDNKFIPIFVELTYIRHPKKLNHIDGVGCELSEHTHQEIVEMAVKSILETIESPRYQTQSMENMESE